VNREAHPCSALCSDKGICHIETAPQSIEATFTGRHETFQYTKVIQSSSIVHSISLILVLVHTRFVDSQKGGVTLTLKQLQNGCNVLRLFRLGKLHMKGPTIIAKKPSRFTSARLGECILTFLYEMMFKRCRCENCSYFCTLPLGKVDVRKPLWMLMLAIQNASRSHPART